MEIESSESLAAAKNITCILHPSRSSCGFFSNLVDDACCTPANLSWNWHPKTPLVAHLWSTWVTQTTKMLFVNSHHHCPATIKLINRWTAWRAVLPTFLVATNSELHLEDMFMWIIPKHRGAKSSCTRPGCRQPWRSPQKILGILCEISEHTRTLLRAGIKKKTDHSIIRRNRCLL